jgi:hypothetical protein
MDPDYLAVLKRRGWIGVGIIVGCLAPFAGIDTSLLLRMI